MRLLFLLGLLLPVFLPAQDLILREAFRYAPGNPLFCADGGRGWAGGWIRRIGDDAVIERGNRGAVAADDGSLNHSALLPHHRAGLRYDRNFERIRDEGQTVWMQFDIDFGAGGPINSVANLTLLSNGEQVLSVGKKFGNGRVGLVVPGANGYDTPLAAVGHYRMVMRLDFSGNASRERLWLWIDPEEADLDASGVPMIAAADLAAPGGGQPGPQLNAGFNGFQLKVEGTAGNRVAYDNLALGTTYAAVQPDFVSSARPTAATGPAFTLAPNPAPAGQLWLELGLRQPTAAFLELYGSNGQLLRRDALGDLAAGNHRFAVGSLTQGVAAGVYTVTLATAGGARRSRLVVIR